MADTPNLGAVYVEEAQGSKEVTINEGFDKFDEYAGANSLTVTGGTYNATEDEAGGGIIVLTGTLVSNLTLVLPDTLSKRAIVIDRTSGAFTKQAKIGSGGTLRTIPRAGAIAIWPTGYHVIGAVAKRGAVVILAAGFTPSGTGADVAEVPVPYDPTDGTTALTWNVRRITFRNGSKNTGANLSTIQIEKSTGTGVFSGSNVGSAITLDLNEYEESQTGISATVASGDKLRFNVSALGDSSDWTITVELEES